MTLRGGESGIKGQEMRPGRPLKRIWIVACRGGTNKLLAERKPLHFAGHFLSQWFNGFHACFQGMSTRSKARASHSYP